MDWVSAVRFIHGAPDSCPAADAALVAVDVTSRPYRSFFRPRWAAARTLVLPDPPTPEITVSGAVPSTMTWTAVHCSADSDHPRSASNRLTAVPVRQVGAGD